MEKQAAALGVDQVENQAAAPVVALRGAQAAAPARAPVHWAAVQAAALRVDLAADLEALQMAVSRKKINRSQKIRMPQIKSPSLRLGSHPCC